MEQITQFPLFDFWTYRKRLKECIDLSNLLCFFYKYKISLISEADFFKNKNTSVSLKHLKHVLKAGFS